MKFLRVFYCGLLLTCIAPALFAQNAQKAPLRLDITAVEKLFIANNFDLLASKYDIDKAQAEIITAKLFDNPEISYENLLYNHETKKFLETSYETGQYSAQISQLFKLAGKRNKSIKLAQSGVKQAQFEYFDLIRTLKFELKNTFYKAYYNAKNIHVYEQQLSSSQQLLKSYNLQYQSGNVSTKDVIRIKALVIGLQSDLTNLLNDLEDDYLNLKLICAIPADQPIELVVNKSSQRDFSIEKLPIANILDSAMTNRADFKLAKANLQYSQNNLSLQKAMAIPDVELSLSYDLKGNYPDKYTGIGLKIPIPLFNRNQGEIKKARIAIDASQLGIKKSQNTLENEVYNTYNTALRTERLYKNLEPGFSAEFDKLIAGLISNFKSRNISLIEFLDLYEAYKDNCVQTNNLEFQRISTLEEINYVTGTNLFK